jgi:hypothetical protein
MSILSWLTGAGAAAAAVSQLSQMSNSTTTTGLLNFPVLGDEARPLMTVKQVGVFAFVFANVLILLWIVWMMARSALIQHCKKLPPTPVPHTGELKTPAVTPRKRAPSEASTAADALASMRQKDD